MKKIIYLPLIILLVFLTSCGKYTVTTSILGEETTYTYKKAKDMREDVPSVAGYHFLGWYLDEAFTKEYQPSNDKNIKIYAKLERFYTFILHIGNNTEVEEFSEDDLVILEEPSLAGSTFKGWYLDAGLKNKFEGEYQYPTSDLELYASFEGVKYQVSFDTDGGTSIKSQNILSGSTASLPSRPKKLYKLFNHWETADGAEFDFNTPITANITLYAVWDDVSYDGLIDDYIPDIVEGDLDFAVGNDDLEFYWDVENVDVSDSSTYITKGGKYNPGRTDANVLIELTIYPIGLLDSVTFEKEVVVKKYTLDALEIGNVVVGYSSTWYYTAYSDQLLATCDVVNLSFAYVNANGTLDMSSLLVYINEMIAPLHQAGIRVCLSIQGYAEATKNFSDCAADPNLRKTLADSMIEIVKKYHLDGIDIDWEYPGSYSGRASSVDRVNYTYLMQEIRNGLNALGSDYLLTAAIPAGSWGAGCFEMSKVAQIFDFINMMSYDMESSSAGTHHCALYPSTIPGGTATGSSISETVDQWVGLGVPTNKICLGIAFYGKQLTVRRPNSNNGLGAQKDDSISGNKYTNYRYSVLVGGCLKYIGKTYSYLFDYSACAPYIYVPTAGLFRTYDNELSVLYKCEYAKSKSLAGVMIWELGEDPTNTLITAVAQGMDRHIEGAPYIIGGTLKLSVNQRIAVQTVNEVINSSLADSLEYIYSVPKRVREIDGLIYFTEAGTYTISAYNTNGICYGTMEVEVI